MGPLFSACSNKGMRVSCRDFGLEHPIAALRIQNLAVGRRDIARRQAMPPAQR
jgi:hypothetical protein